MSQETENVSTPEQPRASESSPLSERMAQAVSEKWQAAQTEAPVATESATAETQSAAESSPTPEGAEPQAAETTPVTAKPASGDEVPFSPEQLGDPAFWGGLDKEGWAKAERLHPVETKHIKSAQAAATRIVNKARKEVATPEPVPATQTAEEPLDSELQEILDAIDLGGPQERVNALRRLVQREVAVVPEVKAQREQSKVQQVINEARDLAMNGDLEMGLPAMPEVDTLDEAELDAAYEKDPEAQALTKVGTPLTIALAIRRVTQTVLAQKRNAVAEKKYQDEQAVLRRNADTPPSNAVTSRAGGPVLKQGETPQQFVSRQWAESAKRSNS